MQSDKLKFDGELQELKPDSRIANLLGSLPNGQDVLPWQDMLVIVDSAPSVKVAWYVRFFHTNQRQLRLAALPLTILLMVCSLWVMPAQSNHAGTVVVTTLPAAWAVGSPAFTEVENAARSGFSNIDNPQADLFIKVGNSGQGTKLVFALLGVGNSEAREFYSQLSDTYPALTAFNENYIDISNGRYDNRFEEIFDSLARKLNSSKLGKADEIKLNVLKFLRESGFDDIEVSVSKAKDGSLTIEIDAAIKLTVPTGTPEDLLQFGLTEELLGPDGFNSLVLEMETTN